MCLFIFALLERTFPHFGQVASPVWVFMWWLREDLNLNVLGQTVQGKPSPSYMPSSLWYPDKFQYWAWPGIGNTVQILTDITNIIEITNIYFNNNDRMCLNGWKIPIKWHILVDWLQIHVYLMNPCKMSL